MRKVLHILETFVPEPCEVEAHLVPSDQLVVGESLEPLGLDPLVPVFGVVAGYEVVQISTSERVCFKVKCLLVRRSYTHSARVQASSAPSRRWKNKTLAFTPWA